MQEIYSDFNILKEQKKSKLKEFCYGAFVTVLVFLTMFLAMFL